MIEDVDVDVDEMRRGWLEQQSGGIEAWDFYGRTTTGRTILPRNRR